FFIRRDLGEFCLEFRDIKKATDHLAWAQKRAARQDKDPIKVKKVEIPIARSEVLRLRMLQARCSLFLNTPAGDRKARAAFLAIEKEIANDTANDNSAVWTYLSIDCQGAGGLAELDRRNGNVVSAINRLRRCLKELSKLKEPKSWQMQFNGLLALSVHYRNL